MRGCIGHSEGNWLVIDAEEEVRWRRRGGKRGEGRRSRKKDRDSSMLEKEGG